MSAKIDRYKNWDATVEDGILTIKITVDKDKVDVQPSKSGKTLIVSTTGGFRQIAGTDLKFNMTLFRKP